MAISNEDLYATVTNNMVVKYDSLYVGYIVLHNITTVLFKRMLYNLYLYIHTINRQVYISFIVL